MSAKAEQSFSVGKKKSFLGGMTVVLEKPGTFDFSPQKHLSTLRCEDVDGRVGPGQQV